MKLSRLPWWTKILVKSSMRIFPLPYEHIRSKITGFRGAMETAHYASVVFDKYTTDYRNFASDIFQGTLLDLGPGGSLLSGIMGRCLGFERCILIDVGDFASRDIAVYNQMVEKLPEIERAKFREKLSETGDILDAFRQIEVFYYAGGLSSLRQIPDETINFSFSNAVLEHVRIDEFPSMINELHRIHSCESITSHQIDYKDHLGNSLNNLRFPRKIWESRFFPNSGFYTNRLRHKDVKEIFTDQGFSIAKDEVKYWDEIPLGRNKMASEFQHYTDDELQISGARLVCKKN